MSPPLKPRQRFLPPSFSLTVFIPPGGLKNQPPPIGSVCPSLPLFLRPSSLLPPLSAINPPQKSGTRTDQRGRGRFFPLFERGEGREGSRGKKRRREGGGFQGFRRREGEKEREPEGEVFKAEIGRKKRKRRRMTTQKNGKISPNTITISDFSSPLFIPVATSRVRPAPTAPSARVPASARTGDRATQSTESASAQKDGR